MAMPPGMASALMGLFIYAGGTGASLLMGTFQTATRCLWPP